jgi:hypothetical protein
MILAVLFDSDDPKFNGMRVPAIRDRIFKSSVPQSSNQPIKISYGGVSIYEKAKTDADYAQLAEDLHFGGGWTRLSAHRVRATYRKDSVWAWVIENI